ncbi:WxL protein peptidoglycan domain-containing protein [Actinoplanes sp. NPDC048988]|uniref:WxL protein peptidoglycan domain-containing protein n=1 Tax=Actinoplanes sp. NPDC048988 TaxID=3363901 RepID=UPI00371899CD
MIVRGALAAVLLFVLAPAPAQAALDKDGVRWSVQPSTAKGPDGRDYVVRRAAPGERLTDYVGITNLTAEPLTFNVYGTDAFTTEDGSFSLLAAAQKPTDVGSWIGLAAAKYTVPANTRLDVPFSVSVPANATPGDHAGGVVTSIAQETTGANGQKVLVDQRVAARVYLTVAGAAAPKLTIDNVRMEYSQSANPADGGSMTVRYLVRNAGNLRLSGTGSVKVTGPFGWKLAQTGAMDIPELLPGGSITITEKITGVQPTVRLAADVDVQPLYFAERLPAVARSTNVWAWPWALLAVLGAALLYLVFRFARGRRRRPTSLAKDVTS